MDITTPTPITSTATVVKTPEAEAEAEAETPASRIHQPIKPLTFTNGVLKRLNHHHHQAPPPPPPAAAAVTYKECLKNHAATMGGHAVDGCGEFMPSPTAVPTDPTSLKCAACGCHRNFHRRDPEEPIPHHLPPPPTTTTTTSAQHVIEYRPHHRHHPPPPPPPPPQPRGGDISPNSASPPPISSSYYPSAPHMLLALSSGLPEASHPGAEALMVSPSSSNGRKRFRTRFTQEQKTRMLEFAEKVGWKFQKRDEESISEFCGQVGVDRVVLKVWMHNNKNTLGRKSLLDDHPHPHPHHHLHVANGNGNGNISSSTLINNTAITATDHHHNNHHNHNHNHLNNDSVSSENVVATNGSSSSS